MGLDMYLYRRRYVKAWEFQNPNERPHLSLRIGDKEIPLINPSYVEEEIGYWRKANEIHGWIIENCAGGEDNCEPVQLELEQIEELLNVCKQVLEASVLVPGSVYAGTQYTNGQVNVRYESGWLIQDPTLAKELLPVTSGFFFGNYGSDGQNPYDKYYLDDVKKTVEILQAVVDYDDTYDVSYYYQASW